MSRLHFFFRLLPVFLLLWAGGCKQRRPAPVANLMTELEGTWILSQEENSDSALVYRPNTYAFPTSRSRPGFAIKSYGRFVQFDLARGAGLASRPGAWTIDRKNLLRINLEQGPNPSYTLEIVSLDSAKRILKVRRLPESPGPSVIGK
jgi:hypothetical protein